VNRSIVTFLLLISLLAAISSPLFAQATLPTDEELISVIRNNIKALNEKNLKAAMDAIDPTSPAFASTETMTSQMFQLYDLKFEIVSAKVIDKKADEARVRVVQTTRKIKGPAFKDNETTAIQVLKNVNGQWKISGTIMESTKELNSPQNGLKDQG